MVVIVLTSALREGKGEVVRVVESTKWEVRQGTKAKTEHLGQGGEGSAHAYCSWQLIHSVRM